MRQVSSMPGSIILLLDCSSPYSYFAFIQLQRIKALLSEYQITTDIVPIFLGGIMQASGNKPPGSLPARGKYLKYDLTRTCKYFGTEQLSPPPFFPMLSLLPQRCMTVIKREYDDERFRAVFEQLWRWVFVRHVDLAKPENMQSFLQEHKFDDDEVKKIFAAAGSSEIKQELNARTKKCYEEYGAYGAPWFWLTKTDGEGNTVSEPCFGSDRWHYIYEFFGLPWKNIELLPAARL